MAELSKDDLDQLDEIRPLVTIFSEALFLTVAAGAAKATRSAYVRDRDKANAKWDELLVAVATFARKD